MHAMNLLQFGLDVSTGQRILPVDMAVNLWLLVFSQQAGRYAAILRILIANVICQFCHRPLFLLKSELRFAFTLSQLFIFDKFCGSGTFKAKRIRIWNK
jgi:hypothetical protein